VGTIKYAAFASGWLNERFSALNRAFAGGGDVFVDTPPMAR
jgi:hypothetical protein